MGEVSGSGRAVDKWEGVTVESADVIGGCLNSLSGLEDCSLYVSRVLSLVVRPAPKGPGLVVGRLCTTDLLVFTLHPHVSGRRGSGPVRWRRGRFGHQSVPPSCEWTFDKSAPEWNTPKVSYLQKVS